MIALLLAALAAVAVGRSRSSSADVGGGAVAGGVAGFADPWMNPAATQAPGPAPAPQSATPAQILRIVVRDIGRDILARQVTYFEAQRIVEDIRAGRHPFSTFVTPGGEDPRGTRMGNFWNESTGEISVRPWPWGTPAWLDSLLKRAVSLAVSAVTKGI